MFNIECGEEGRIGLLKARRGEVLTPTVIPVHVMKENEKGMTVDDILRPHLERLTPTLMMSAFSLFQLTSKNVRKDHNLESRIIFVDSGGYAFLERSTQAKIEENEGLGCIRSEETVTTPKDVLEIQEEVGDIGCSLDIPIRPGASLQQAEWISQLNLRNAKFAAENSSDNLMMFGVVQAWDYESAKRLGEELSKFNFDGYCVGGLVPRVNDPIKVVEIVLGVKEVVPEEKPVHVFGLSNFRILPILFLLGVDTVDTSTYIQSAASGKYFSPGGGNASLSNFHGDRLPCSCPICRSFTPEYLSGSGVRPLAMLSLHNLHVLEDYITFLRGLIRANQLRDYVRKLVQENRRLKEAFHLVERGITRRQLTLGPQ